MKHHLFIENPNNKYQVAILIKSGSFSKKELQNNYVDFLNQEGIHSEDIIAFTLSYNIANKAPVSHIKEYLAKLLPALDSLGVQSLYVADSAYFKVLAGKSKADTHLGYVLPCKIKGYEHMNVVLGVNYSALIYNPDLQSKVLLGLQALADHKAGTYNPPGIGIIHSAHYPVSFQDIATALQSLHKYPSLTCDIEAFSLRFNEAGIGTISFAWNQHEGIAFAVDYLSVKEPIEGNYGFISFNRIIRSKLKKFFTVYQGEITFHSSTYDVKILIYNLWMDTLLDTKGLLTGLDIMCKHMHDTKIIAYLATNSTAGNHLGLKHLAHEFAGNYAMAEIKDIRKIPLDKLLEYNLIDALSTHYVRNKYEPIMEHANQGDLYRGLMLDSLKLIIQLELTGMPMSRKRIQEVKVELLGLQEQYLDNIYNHSVIVTLNLVLQTNAMVAANAKLKVKQHPLSKFVDVGFNPNSNRQLQVLLYEVMGLPVIDLTDTKQPATGADTIEKLIHHITDPVHELLLSNLTNQGKVAKILSTFIPAFERAISKDNSDTVWLHGSFNLGGAVSGRLSSSDPNLQNLPATSEYGKLVKSCFIAPKKWLMVGADFNSLEDMISALTTKDKNKLKVYTDGFCGHCLRASYYFADQCPDIDSTDPVSVNSMKKKYPVLRQDSKGPTFALTYQGTWHTLVNNLGFSKEKAKEIEKGYHDLYHESDKYIQDKLKQASIDGYVTVAFGLRVRTPLLAQIVYGSPKVPYEAQAEGRTAGNALGQSYGLLNNRAAVEFMQKVWASKYRLDILPIGLIHDSIYLLIKDDIKIVDWVNRELIISMQWQELIEIQHPIVKLGANLDCFYENWSQPVTLPNSASIKEILKIAKDGEAEYNKGK